MSDNKKELELTELRAQMSAMLEEARAQSAALIETARAEAARIVAEASGRRGGPVGMTAEEQTAYEAYMNEEVEVRLFKDNDRYRDPVFVGCNGETVAIQRGIPVKVKRKFAEILDNSDKQDYETGLLIQRKCAEFSGAAL